MSGGQLKSQSGAVLWMLLLLVLSFGTSHAADGRFIGEVVAKWLPNGRDMEIGEPFGYIDAGSREWSVPKGAVVDGASIPKALWSVLGAPFSGKYRKASVVHDYFCQTMVRPWQDVHHMFFEASLTEGNSSFQAKLMYGAVYAWGPRWDTVDGKAVRTRDIVRTPTESEIRELASWIKKSDPPLADIDNYAKARFPRAAPMAERRVALVIGNAAYQYTPKLVNPRNDAIDLSETLKGFGYDVIEGLDLDKAGLERIIHRFARSLREADAGVFFYAGHSLQFAGQNYLVPVDAKLEDATGLDFEMVRLDLVHRTMERETKTNVIFLDACRDNPLARNLARALGTRTMEVGRGLAAVESGSGTLISFSTQPGNVALDGSGRNSPFAEALVKRIRQDAAREDLSRLLIGVRNDVMAATKNKQVPWENSALRKPFYFTPAAGAISVPLALTTRGSAGAKYDKEMELAFWTTVRDAKSIVLLQTYLDRYPDGHFAELARALIEHLQKEQSARDAAARGQEKAVLAEDARKLAAAKQGEEQRKLDAAKQAHELALAREKLREAKEATERAKAEQQAALRASEEARKEAEKAKAAQQRVIRQADHQAKVVSANTPAGSPARTDANRPVSEQTATGSQPSKTGQAIRVDLAKAKALRSVAISKDGSLIAVAGDDTYVRLLSTADLRLVRTLKGHRERVHGVAFSPDGKVLASAGWDGAIKLWTLATTDVETLTSGAAKFYSVAFDPKVPLKYVLAGDGEGFVHIWDLQKKARVGKPEEHNGPVRAISFYPDSSGTFVSVGADGKIRARSWKSGMKDIQAHAGGGFFSAYSADGSSVLTAGGDKKLKLWQSTDFRLLKSFEGHSKYVLTAALSPDGKTMASGGGDSAVLLWDIHSGQIVQKLAGHETDVESVAFYRDGKRVVSVSEDKTLRVWDSSTGEKLAVAVGFTDGEYLAYSSDGKYTASDGGHAHLKVLQDGTERDADKQTRAQLFSSSGLAINSR